MTDTLFKIFLAVHVLGGGIGLAAGTINMFRPKGDRIHKIAGMYFFYGMLTAATAALVLSVMHRNYFLFITGVFTFYMVSTGKRYLLRRQLPGSPKPNFIDWALTLGMLVFGIAFISLGAYKLFLGNTFGLVFIAFGFIGSSMVRADIKNYTQPPADKSLWLTTHLQRMIGAYIAATTAFLVVNLPHGILPDSLSFIPWLLPTALLVPLIYKWTAKYSTKKKEA